MIRIYMSLFNKMSTTREEAKRIQEKRAKEADEAMGLTAHGEYRSSSNKASPTASVSAPAKKWGTVAAPKLIGHGRKSRKSRKTRKSKKTRGRK